MSDETDRATSTEELLRNAAIANSSALANLLTHKSKRCLECGALTKGKRWCDSDCETAYSQRKRFNRGL